jgi:hypothetical protein
LASTESKRGEYTNKIKITNEKQAAVVQLATLEKEIVDFLATREDNYKKATKVIKQQIADFAEPLYEKRRADYHAIKPMKEHRAGLQKVVLNCDVAIANLEKAEKGCAHPSCSVSAGCCFSNNRADCRSIACSPGQEEGKEEIGVKSRSRIAPRLT